MNQLLTLGQRLSAPSSGMTYTVERFLGGGGQGEVYQATMGSAAVALKWYFPHYLASDPRLKDRISEAVKRGSPSDRFLWPMETISTEGVPGFGYAMPLREERFKGIVDVMKRHAEPTFRALITAGFELAHSYRQLHAKGLCYRDISFGNIFLDPVLGEVRICDNDNVDINGTPGTVDGTPRFMAPEIVREEASPSTDTDLFSLALLLFYMFVMHHPLEGKRESDIKCFDLPAMRQLYGTDPLFIFDPNDRSNEPVLGYHDNAITFWPIYPEPLRSLFTKAFTVGLCDPQNGRVRESEWAPEMIRLRDSIVYCTRCGMENFADREVVQRPGGIPSSCWSCRSVLQLPARLRIEGDVVMLNHDTKLFPHHIGRERWDFSRPVAAVVQHPTNPGIWGLKNLSDTKWVSAKAGSMQDVERGRSVTLAVGTKINFGMVEGEICA